MAIVKSGYEGKGVVEVVAALIADKAVINWAGAKKTCGLPGVFRASDCGAIVKAFEGVEAGASALITDSEGKFATSPKTTGHQAWLSARGYAGEQVPAYKEKVVRSSSGASKASTALVTGLMAGMSAEDKAALVKALLGIKG